MSRSLRFAVSALLLGWVAWATDWAKVAEAFAHLRAAPWAAAVAVAAAGQVVSTLRWRSLASSLGVARPFGHMLGFYFIGMYFSLFLPTSMGGDVVKVLYLDGGAGRKARAFVSVFLDRLCGLIVLLTLAGLGVLLSPTPLPGWVSGSVLACVAGGALGVALLPVAVRYGHRAPWKLRRVLAAFAALPSARALAWPTLLSLPVQAACVLTAWLTGLAVGADVPAAYYWVLVPMVSLLTMIPSVNGIGVREGSMVLLLAPLGVAPGTALTLSFLWFAVTVALSLGGGLVYLFGHFPRPAQDSNEGGNQDGPVDRDPGQGRAGQPRAAA